MVTIRAIDLNTQAHDSQLYEEQVIAWGLAASTWLVLLCDKLYGHGNDAVIQDPCCIDNTHTPSLVECILTCRNCVIHALRLGPCVITRVHAICGECMCLLLAGPPATTTRLASSHFFPDGIACTIVNGECDFEWPSSWSDLIYRRWYGSRSGHLAMHSASNVKHTGDTNTVGEIFGIAPCLDAPAGKNGSDAPSQGLLHKPYTPTTHTDTHASTSKHGPRNIGLIQCSQTMNVGRRTSHHVQWVIVDSSVQMHSARTPGILIVNAIDVMTPVPSPVSIMLMLGGCSPAWRWCLVFLWAVWVALKRGEVRWGWIGCGVGGDVAGCGDVGVGLGGSVSIAFATRCSGELTVSNCTPSWPLGAARCRTTCWTASQRTPGDQPRA